MCRKHKITTGIGGAMGKSDDFANGNIRESTIQRLLKALPPEKIVTLLGATLSEIQAVQAKLT